MVDSSRAAAIAAAGLTKPACSAARISVASASVWRAAAPSRTDLASAQASLGSYLLLAQGPGFAIQCGQLRRAGRQQCGTGSGGFVFVGRDGQVARQVVGRVVSEPFAERGKSLLSLDRRAGQPFPAHTDKPFCLGGGSLVGRTDPITDRYSRVRMVGRAADSAGLTGMQVTGEFGGHAGQASLPQIK